MATSHKRQRCQYSLRSLILLPTICCLPLAWLAYERNEVQRREAAIAAIKKHNGYVSRDEEGQLHPSWLRWLLSETSDGKVLEVALDGSNVTDAGRRYTVHGAGPAQIAMPNT